MISLIHSYILKVFFKYFFLSLSVFSFILMSGTVLKMIPVVFQKETEGFVLVLFLLYLVPYILYYTLPLSLVSSVVMTTTQMSRNNECVAMFSMGMSFLKIISPILWTALFFSFFFLFIVNPIVDRSRLYMRTLLTDAIYQNPHVIFKENHFIKSFKDYIVHIKKIDNNKLQGVTIYQFLNSQVVRSILADEASVQKTDTETFLNLRNGTALERNKEKFYKMDFESFPIILKSETKNGHQKKLFKKVKEMTFQELRDEMQKLPLKNKKRRRLLAEFHKKIAFSFAGLILVLLGVPCSFHFYRRDRSGIGIIVFLTAFYYILLALAKGLCHSNMQHIGLITWMPNIVTATIGLFLIFIRQK